MNRRSFIKTGAIGSLTLGVAGHAVVNGDILVLSQPTPAEIKGPFYPVIVQKDKDFDLTKVQGRNMEALGERIIIQGNIFDTEGNPIEEATVDVWQANAAGKYSHPHDSNAAPVDDNFQGWAIVLSSKDGGFRFKSVLPGIYPVGDGWSRPPHIHFKVTKKGYIELITQMYFPGHLLNEVDRLLQNKSIEEQQLMIAERSSDDANIFNFRILIEKA
jgi:protocatechuate 3,4-dioxygenase beta subunit